MHAVRRDRRLDGRPGAGRDRLARRPHARLRRVPRGDRRAARRAGLAPDRRRADGDPHLPVGAGGADQRLDPVGDLARHRDRARRALDGARVQHRVDDVLQVRVVARDDAAQQVAIAGHAVHLEHLGDPLQPRDGLLEPALDDLQRDEGEHRIAHLRGLDVGAEAGDHAARRELVHPRLHGPARDAEAARDLDHADARMRPQHQQQAGVELVDLLRHDPRD